MNMDIGACSLQAAVDDEELIRALSARVKELEAKLNSAQCALCGSRDHAAKDCPWRQVVPDGWHLVPVEPTDDMVVAFAEGWYSRKQAIDDPDTGAAYAAMLAAAPQPAEQSSGRNENRTSLESLPCLGNSEENPGVRDFSIAQVDLCELPESVLDAVADALRGTYDCTRVWEAWFVGTMSQDDFHSVADSSDRVEEIARAAVSAYRAALSRPGDTELLDELRATLCSVATVGRIDGYPVIRRESVIDLIDRRRNSNKDESNAQQ